MCYTRFGAYPNHTHIKIIVKKKTCGKKRKRKKKRKESNSIDRS
jgi:hypothetical protein